MNLARKSRVISAAVAVAAILFATQVKNIDAQEAVFDATVDGTLDAGLPAVSSAVSADADANNVLTVAKQVFQISQEARELTGFVSNLSRIKSAGGLQSVIAGNNASPLTEGTVLAETLVNASPNDGSGVLTSSDLSDLEGEISNAIGNLQGQGANLDAMISMVTGQKETTDLQAAIELQHETGVVNAFYEQQQALDIAASVPCNNCSGGFQAPNIRDYSQSAPGQNPGSVF